MELRCAGNKHPVFPCTFCAFSRSPLGFLAFTPIILVDNKDAMVSAPETQQRQQAALGNGRPSPPGKDEKRRSSSFFGTVRSALKRAPSSARTLVNPTPSPPGTSAGRTPSSYFPTPTFPANADSARDEFVKPAAVKSTLSHAPAPAPTPTSSQPATISLAKSLFEQLKGGTLGSDVETVMQALGSITGPMDDRELLLEHVVKMLQNLPSGSPFQQPLTEKLIDLLYHDLEHPSTSSVGPAARAVDGGGQNPSNPKLGAANTPYARSVPRLTPKSPHLPSPEVIFDALLRRREFKPHPSGISSLLFAFATIIIHSAFQTGREDGNINEASSYLDLSPLYGNNEDEQKTVRSFEQGKLFADVIASNRLFFMPPAVVALLCIFNRNHNYIVHHLFKINEDGHFKPWDSLDDAGKKKQDEQLFQQGRLVNCGHFLNVIVQDYIRTILNINRTESMWSLAPNQASRGFPGGWTERGVGNGVSAEFNILYRWHAAISHKDEKWLEGLFAKLIPGKTIDELTKADFGTALGALARTQGKDPRGWTIPGLQRTTTGSFADEDLCRIFTEATDEVAGAFGANGSPAAMRIIDVIGMATARSDWNVCTMNEFRKFLNLKPFNTFEEWNSDPVVADRARRLYGTPDALELFPGLHAEEAKPSMAGSGLAVNYTISRAILSDAVSLVRGDRFFTTDYSSATLSSWGYADVTPDTAGGSYGGCIGKLLMRNLPNSYTSNSTYALFPFSTPATMREVLTANGVIEQYDMAPPSPSSATHGVFTYKACLEVLADPMRFGTIYDEPIKNCSNKYGYFIAEEGEQHKVNRQLQAAALFPDGWQKKIKAFYAEKTRDLIEQAAWSYDGSTKTLDVVKDVTNLAAVYWCSHQFGIPLKDAENPHGLLTPQELYLVLSAFFISVFMNFSQEAAFKLRTAAKKVAPKILALIKIRLAQVNLVPDIVDSLARGLQDLFLDDDAQAVVMGKEAHAYYERLLAANDGTRPMEALESSVQSTMTASVSNQGQAAAHIVNFFLDEENSMHKDELVKLAKLDTAEADKKILALIWEALRLDPQVPLIPRVALEDTTIQDGPDRKVEIKKGDKVFPSMLRAGKDPLVFPNPEKVEKRDASLYRLFGHGAHTCLGAPIVDISLVEIMKQIFRLPNVRRAPGKAGQLVRFHQDVGETPCPVYLSANATPWPLPVSLSIVYDI
ncbi:hypothetical protein JCM11251_006354 [Rhodosporidiobolus azoricus]